MFAGIERQDTSTKRIVAVFTTVAVITALFYTSTTSASASSGCKMMRGSTGNMVMDEQSCMDGHMSEVPDVLHADAQSRAIALGIFEATMRYCIKYPTLGDLRAVGFDKDRDPDGSHHFNVANGNDPDTTKEFENFGIPYTAIVFGNSDSTRNAGMMADQDSKFPYVGSIPHTHRDNDGEHGQDSEMVHVWCRPTIEGAFDFNDDPFQVPSVQALQQALTNAQTRGITAVSSQLSRTNKAGPTRPAATKP